MSQPLSCSPNPSRRPRDTLKGLHGRLTGGGLKTKGSLALLSIGDIEILALQMGKRSKGVEIAIQVLTTLRACRVAKIFHH